MGRKSAEIAFRRTFVLDAARKLFADKGVDKVSMNEIAVAADYTRGSLYNHFKSFDEICLTIYIEEQTERRDMQRNAIRETQTGLARLRVWAESLYQYRKDNPQYGRLEAYWDYRGMNEHELNPELFARFESVNNGLADDLREIFKMGIKDGTMRANLEIDLCISQFLHGYRAILTRAQSTSYSFARFEPDYYANHFLDLFTLAIGEKE